jgi:hypothetical protein
LHKCDSFHSPPKEHRLAFGIAPSLPRPSFVNTTTSEDHFAHGRQDVENLVDGKKNSRQTRTLIESLLLPAMTDANLPPEAEAAAGC